MSAHAAADPDANVPASACAGRAAPGADEAGRGPVLLFDDECGLCQAIVRLLRARDAAGRLRFAPLQGAAAQAWLRERGLPTEDFDTILFVDEWAERVRGPYRERTAGVIAALRALDRGSARTAADLLALVPGPLRDAGYRGVARVRKRIFGGGRPGAWRGPEWAGRIVA
jgi:predicted DCC family thiol-disulfide oxidoreductase YuxK